MRTKLKNKWVAALRSGRYVQGKSHLRHNGCYCVLGVLCDVVCPKNWIMDGWKDPVTGYVGTLFPGQQTCKRLGLSPRSVSVLSNMNDSDVSFEELARLIESRTGRQLGRATWEE